MDCVSLTNLFGTKLLDALGDLALLGRPLIADVSMSRSGHALNAKLVDAIMSDKANYNVVIGRDTERSLVESLPLFGSRVEIT